MEKAFLRTRKALWMELEMTLAVSSEMIGEEVRSWRTRTE
jgi:hypothetical protein